MKITRLLCLIGLSFSASLLGDIADGDLGSFSSNLDVPPFEPFKIAVEGDWIGKSHFDTHSVHHDSIEYATGDLLLSYTLVLNPCFAEGLEFGVGETWDRMKWENNPYFNKDHFSNTYFSLSAFSSRVENMIVQAQAILAFDNAHFNSEYCTVDLLFWSRYALNPCIGIHAGFVAQTGMKIDHIYPVVGFDWFINSQWKLNAIFPLDISLKYAYDCSWDFLVGMRFLQDRHRVGKDEPLSEGLFEYSNTGIEIGVNYHYQDNIAFNVHVGEMFGGEVQVWNKHHDDSHTYSFKAAPYIGADLTFKF